MTYQFKPGDRILMLAVSWNKHAEGQIGTILDETHEYTLDPPRHLVMLDNAIWGDDVGHGEPYLRRLLVGENEMIPLANMKTLETIW